MGLRGHYRGEAARGRVLLATAALLAPPEVRDRPSIFDALKQQLGLKLVAQKGPVDYYVIDHIDRPTDN